MEEEVFKEGVRRPMAPHKSCLFTWEQHHDFDDASCAGHGRASLTSARNELDVLQFLSHVRVPLLEAPNVFRRVACLRRWGMFC